MVWPPVCLCKRCAAIAIALVLGCNDSAVSHNQPRRQPDVADPAHGPADGSGKGVPMTTPDLTTLAASLQADVARDIPPFGASSVKLAQQLGAAATGVLLPRVRGHGPDAFLALEALRAADAAGYAALPADERASIYAAALQHSAYFNSWGQPGQALTDTAHAFAALGDAAVRALTPLLADPRAAPSSGSRDATASTNNRNRVCDYAWVLIHEARHADYVYASSPAERDREIAAMRARLP
jgi:hypothetical protein